jgi:hypothetical protein
MQTRKEVDNMHAALISSRAMNTLIAVLSTLAVGAAMAHTIVPSGEPERMPGTNCPPSC